MYYLEFYKKELSLIPSVFNHLFRSVWTHVDVFCILCCYPILHYSVLQVVPNLSIVELFQGNSCIPLICSRTHFLYCTRCFKFIFFPLVSALESAIFFSKEPGSFYWRMVFKNQDWVLGVLVATRVSLLQGSSGYMCLLENIMEIFKSIQKSTNIHCHTA